MDCFFLYVNKLHLGSHFNSPSVDYHYRIHDHTMDPAVSRLLCLRQGDRTIEDYVEDFCGLCHLVDFNDVALKDILQVGLNEPISFWLHGGK